MFGICQGCKHHAFRVVTKPPAYFTSWGCKVKKLRFGSNREAGQVDRPDKCNNREAK
jgi:hypothetical protein